MDTSVLGIHGKPVIGGTDYDDVKMEVELEDRSISSQENYSLKEARLVLKYVMVMGNKMANAKHILSKRDRMCLKTENVIECGIHLDNRVGHNQFNHAVSNTRLCSLAPHLGSSPPA